MRKGKTQKKLTKEYFSEKAKKYYDEQYAQETNAVIRNRRVMEMIEGNNKILDIGCGVGVLANALKEKGNDVYACDISEEMLKEAKKRYSNLKYSLEDCEKLRYASESFDIVTAIGLFEYLEKDDTVIQEIYRVLKPKGYAIIEFNNKAWHLKMNDCKPADEKYPMPRRCHNPFIIREEFKKYGFELVDLCFFHLDREEDKCRNWEAPYLGCAFIIKIRKNERKDFADKSAY